MSNNDLAIRFFLQLAFIVATCRIVEKGSTTSGARVRPCCCCCNGLVVTAVNLSGASFKSWTSILKPPGNSTDLMIGASHGITARMSKTM